MPQLLQTEQKLYLRNNNRFKNRANEIPIRQVPINHKICLKIFRLKPKVAFKESKRSPDQLLPITRSMQRENPKIRAGREQLFEII